jgi:hypothetical protein
MDGSNDINPVLLGHMETVVLKGFQVLEIPQINMSGGSRARNPLFLLLMRTYPTLRNG